LEIKYHKKEFGTGVIDHVFKDADDPNYFWLKVPFAHQISSIVQYSHSSNSESGIHIGRDRTIQKIRELGFNWVSMYTDVANEMANCLPCKITQMKQKKKSMNIQILSTKPLQRVQLDLQDIGFGLPDQMPYLFELVCHYSKFAYSKRIPDKTSLTIRKCLMEFVSQHGKFNILQCDNGKEFVNQNVLNLLESLEAKMINGSPYHPQTQGSVERFHRTSMTALRRTFAQCQLTKKPFDFDYELANVIYTYNNTIHTTTGQKPFISSHHQEGKDDKEMELIVENTKKSMKNKIQAKMVNTGDKVTKNLIANYKLYNYRLLSMKMSSSKESI